MDKEKLKIRLELINNQIKIYKQNAIEEIEKEEMIEENWEHIPRID